MKDNDKPATQVTEQLKVACQNCELLQAKLDEALLLTKETELLRSLLAWGNDPCIYCGLQSCDMSRCSYGFPGCNRSHDMQTYKDKRGWARWKGQDRRIKK